MPKRKRDTTGRSQRPAEASPSQPNSPPNSPNPSSRPNTKRTGERSEAAFLYQATQRRFAISKPWGDSERYDFILDNRRPPDLCPEPAQPSVPNSSKQPQLFRIQIKCTDSLRAGAYETRATYELAGRHIPYTKLDIDFIAAHVVPLNIWYIIPVEICTPQPMLRFYPHRQAKQMRLEIYREAWHFLDPPLANPPLTILACIDENYLEEDYSEACVPGQEPETITQPRSGERIEPTASGAKARAFGKSRRHGESRDLSRDLLIVTLLIVVASLLNVSKSEGHHPRIAVRFSANNLFAVNSFWGDCLLARSANGLGLGCAKVFVS